MLWNLAKPGDAGGLEYYTGLTFKVFVAGSGSEIGSGGRYDNLLGNFGTAEAAVGFSFALDGLVAALSGKTGLVIKSEHAQSVDPGEDPTSRFLEARKLRDCQVRIKIS